MSALVGWRLPGCAEEKTGNGTRFLAFGGGPAARSLATAAAISSRTVTPRSTAAILVCFISWSGKSRVVLISTSSQIAAARRGARQEVGGRLDRRSGTRRARIRSTRSRHILTLWALLSYYCRDDLGFATIDLAARSGAVRWALGAPGRLVKDESE